METVFLYKLRRKAKTSRFSWTVGAAAVPAAVSERHEGLERAKTVPAAAADLLTPPRPQYRNATGTFSFPPGFC